jgi:hypothetical protein
MDKKLITEIYRIREIISGKNILLEQIPPKLSQEIFDFALKQGDEFIDFITPIAQKEAQRVGAVTDDLIDIFTKQIDDYDAGFSTVKGFSDDSLRLILRNATTEEFVEFLLKSKIIPSQIDNITSSTIKKVAELGRKGTPVSEEYIEATVKNYETTLEQLDWLSDEMKDGLVSRYRKQINQARVPSLSKVGLDVTPEAVLRNVFGEDVFNSLKGMKDFKVELARIETKLRGKTWDEAVEEATSQIDNILRDDKFKSSLGNLDSKQSKYFGDILTKTKNALIVYRKEIQTTGLGKQKVYAKAPDGELILNIPLTLLRFGSALFGTLLFIDFLWYFVTQGTVSGTSWFLMEKLGAFISGIKGGVSSVRETFSKVSEDEAKDYMQNTMQINTEDYSFEIDNKDPNKMIALWVGEGDGIDYLIYKKNTELGHTTYTEEYRNKSLFDIFKD